MWESYENKSYNVIKQDIKKEFKRIENSKKWRYRDDQEIYESWINVINKYINQLSNASWLWVNNKTWWVKDWKATLIPSANLYRWEALKYFRNARDHFNKRWKEVIKEHWICWMYITTSLQNEEQIKEIAKAINTAEETALKKIKMVCNPKQEQQNASEYSSAVRDKKWNVKVEKWKVVKQKPLFNHTADWTLTFTDRVNHIKINQALGNLYNDKNKVYKIDYSKCTNNNIKNRMKKIIWWFSCWIKYDKNTNNYVISDKTWNILSGIPPVWEWVTLKQDIIIMNQSDENDWLTREERSSLEKINSTSKNFEFNEDDFKYYEEYRQLHKVNICASYAYWCVADILSKLWYCFPEQEVSAWEISGQSFIANHFYVNKLSNPQWQILNAPAGSILTLRYDRTWARASWVSHAMVSLWNGVYTDMFWEKIRKIDFKTEIEFSWSKINYWGQSFTLTEDARLMTPNLRSFQSWSLQTINWENLTPSEFTEQVYNSTWANRNYIRTLIAKQNNIPARDFWKKFKNLSIKIITREIHDLDLDNKEWSNYIAKTFLDSLKDYKRDIMNHYPKLTDYEYDEIAKRAIWVLYQETNAGKSVKYRWKEYLHSIGVTKLISRDWSRWYTQIKFNQLFDQDDKEFLKTFGIYSEKDLVTAEKCWIATMVWMISNYVRMIIPMKRDPFRRNDAEIIEIEFKDGEKESIAKWKSIKIWNERRPRTKAEIQEIIKEWGDKHWWILKQRPITRYWITDDDDFYQFLYYAWNKPSEITYWTATPKRNVYIAQTKKFVNENLIT